TWDGKNPPNVEYLCNMPPGVNYTGLSSFGIDENNELYMLKMGRPSRIYKLVNAESMEQTMGVNVAVPKRISQLNVFADLAQLTTDPGIIPYDVNVAFWSDGAMKERWMALPGNEQITYSPAGTFSFPAGTVFMKNFELTVNENTGAKRRLET